MRFLIRIASPPGEKADFLAVVRSVASSLGVQVRNPKWASYGALEIDLFTESRGDFELCLLALEPLGRIEFSRDLNVSPLCKPADETVTEARELFNAERYWESHEVLEGLWMNLAGEERFFVQGVILVCAAFVHHQKGEEGVALGVLERAHKQLRYDRKDYCGIRVDHLRDSVAEILETGAFRPFGI